jgi:transposase
MMMTGEAAVGATRGYVCPDRDQLFLLPVCMRDWLAEGHLAWFVLDVVASLDTRALHRRPGGCAGRRPYQPEMMCALLLYGYCTGVRFSRRIEAGCRTDAAFRVISGGLVPDHATIARFVVDHERALEGLFCEGVRLCAAAGLTDLSVLALDGTKIAADAALDQKRGARWIGEELGKLMALTAQDADGSEDWAPGLPGVQQAAQLATPRGREARLRAALAVIEAEDAAQAAQAARWSTAAVASAKHGLKVRGRKPKEPFAALARAETDHAVALERLTAAQALQTRKRAAARRGEKLTGRCRIKRHTDALTRAQTALDSAREAVKHATPTAPAANITDPDSRIMKTQDGWVQGYNAQAIVNQHQIVLACQVSQNAGDVLLYEPMIQTLTDTLTQANVCGEIELVLADAGYWSEHNATTPGPDRLIATMKDHKQRQAARELGHTTGPPPDSTPIDEMEHLLRTPQGAAAYAQRSHLIEPVFADHKHNRQMRSFRRRGLDAARSEWAFMQLAANMLKLHHHQTATASA